MRISYVITVYNKAPYLAQVVESLCAEWRDGGAEALEYVFVDDGSTDDSVRILHDLAPQLPGTFKIIEQENMGAAYATNAGVAAVKHDWVRLLDGDDVVCINSTRAMYEAGHKSDTEFILGGYDYFDMDQPLLAQITMTAAGFDVLDQDAALKKFIKNFSYNSSGMLVHKHLFSRMDGSDIRLKSPDYSMALRGVVHSPRIVIMHDDTAQMAREAPGRLSSQIGRSRYESILVLYYLAFELLPERKDIAKAVYKRSCSRSYRYARVLKNKPFYHGLRYYLSKIFLPQDLRDATYKCLGAYTPDGSTERPDQWKPGAVLKSED